MVDLAAAHSFHHGKMLEIVVSLEESVTGKEFDNDAAYTPDVARKTPSEL